MAGAEQVTATGKAKWTRLAALGLVMAGLGPVLILTAILIWGLDPGEDLGFFLTAIAVAFVASFLVWRFGTWSKIVGVIAGLLLAAALFWTAFGLEHPGSFFDFMVGILVMPGALLAVGASIAALVAGRRGTRTARAEGGERRAIQVALSIVALAALVSGAFNLFARPTATAEEAELRAAFRDFKFDRSEYVVPGGTTMFVSNDDPVYHTFTIDELGIDEAFVGASSRLIEFPNTPGTYTVYCRPHTQDPQDPGEDDMTAQITVR